MKKRIAILIGIICTFLFVCSSCHKDSVFVDSIKDLELQILDEYEDDLYIKVAKESETTLKMQVAFYSSDTEADLRIASDVKTSIDEFISNNNEFQRKNVIVYFEYDRNPNSDTLIGFVTNKRVDGGSERSDTLSYLCMKNKDDYNTALTCFNGIDTIDCREVSLNSTSNILANSDSIHYVYVDESIYESISELYPDIVFCY